MSLGCCGISIASRSEAESVQSVGAVREREEADWMMSSAPSPEYTWLRIDRPRSTLSCRHHPQARARHRKSSSREHAKTGLTASRISPPVVPCYEWRFDHPMRMGILSDQQEPKDLSLNSVTRSSRQAKTSQGRARLVRPGRIRGAGVHPRRQRMLLCPPTACAASPAQAFCR
jgi:hypothetical protein